MSRRLVYGALAAVALAALGIVVWWPGCGWVDVWVIWTRACEAAGGGGGGGAG